MFIKPDNKYKNYWDLFANVATIFAGVEIPMRLVLHYELIGTILILDWVITGIFAIDIIINIIAIHEKNGEPLSQSKSIKHYLSGWFTIDILATVPFDLFFGSVFSLSPGVLRILRMFRLARTLRLARLAQLMKSWQTSQVLNPSIMRLIFFFFWTLLVAHWISCGWIALGGVPKYKELVFQLSHQAADLYGASEYIVKLPLDSAIIQVSGLYWCITTLTTIGYGDISPSIDNLPQMLYTMIVMLLGVGVYGYIIGNVTSALSNMDVQKAAYMKKMEDINSFMKYKDIPGVLQDRIVGYYDHMWENGMVGSDESTILNDLPPSIKTDVAMYINKEILEKVPIFKGAGEECLRSIVNSLYPIVFTPGDFVIRKGEKGDNMYFISTGSVDVVSDDGLTIYTTLVEGAFFGELSLLLEQPRTASIRARTYCHLYILDKEPFDIVLQRFPEFASSVQQIVDMRLKELEGDK